MSPKRRVNSDGGDSKKMRAITMEVKLDIVKRSEKRINSEEHYSVAWIKSVNCRLKHTYMRTCSS